VLSQAQTLVDLLQLASDAPETGIRLLDRRGAATWLSWSVVVERAFAVARALQQYGIRPRDRVALVFPTGEGFLEVFFGAVLAGAVPVPLYPPTHLGRMREYAERTSAMVAAASVAVLVTDGRIEAMLREVRQRTGVRVVTPAQLPRAEVGGGLQGAAVGPHDLALIQFSSGTTAAPKPVALSHQAVVAQATLLNGHWPDSPGEHQSGVSWLPLYHDMGLVGTLFTALERRATLTLIPPEAFVLRPILWLRAISEYRATISPAPTFGYAHCLQRLKDEDLRGIDLSSWRVALCGGETVMPEVLRQFSQRFAPFGLRPEAVTPVYGLAEATLAVTFSPLSSPFVSRRFQRESLERGCQVRPDSGGLELVSLGRPVPGFEVRVCGSAGATLPEGAVGEIECRGPSVMEGYFGMPAETAAAIRDGWLRTGDLGFCFEGALYLTGREKEILIVRGRNHAPDEVERAACAVEGVRAGRAVAASWMPQGGDQEQLVLIVEARRGVVPARFGEIADACRREVIAATGLVPAQVEVVPAGTLPRTSSGKLRRSDALKQYLSGTLRAPDHVGVVDAARYVVHSWLTALKESWS
jgi:acyl-CoA synthetase (AMP-forming)/AMP-acid ligase II